MLGKLIKNKNSEWLVEFVEPLKTRQQIPLHPEDIKKYNEYLFNGREVEFEIVKEQETINYHKDIWKDIKYAKITKTGAFDKKGNAITRGYAEPKDKVLHWLETRFTENAPISYIISEYKKEFLTPIKKQ